MELNRRAVLSAAVAVAAATASGAQAQDLARRNREVFDAVWRRVDREYYDPHFRGVDWAASREIYGPRAEAATDESELYRVLNEMLRQLDDAHALARSPWGVAEGRARERGTANGVGFAVRFAEDHAVVTVVMPGSPAERAGVQVGWLLQSIDGQPLVPGAPRSIPPVDAVFMDAADREVSFRLDGAPYPYTPARIRRDVEGAVYLRFDSFEDEDIDWAVQQVGLARTTPLIVDFRENSGGLVMHMERFMGAFFDRRIRVGEFRTRRGRPIAISFAGRNIHGARLATLVDGGTNSAAELSAAVLQDQGRAIVVGEATPGNVLGSFTSNLPDGGQLILSERDIILASGRRLEGEGVAPDVLAPRTLADFRSGNDPALRAALDQLRV